MKKQQKRKIKDLGDYLTQKTGLNAEERELWRNKIKELGDSGNKAEAMRVFNSTSYFKTTYLS